MTLQIQCPACGATFALREARNDQAWRDFVALLMQIPAAVQQPLMRYLELFQPAKQPNVRSETALKLTEELLPLIKEQRIKRKHNQYDIPHTDWAAAMSYLSSNRNNLQLPLKGNGYLLETLASRAEKLAAKQESAAIEEQRHVTARTGGGMRKAGEVMATQMQPQAITDAAHKLYVPEKLPEMSEEQAAANRRRVSEMLNNALKGVAP